MPEEERTPRPTAAPDTPPEPPMPQQLEELLSDRLAEAAEEVKSGLQDLLPEQTPAEPVAEPPAEPGEPAPIEPSAEAASPEGPPIGQEAEPVQPPPEAQPAPPVAEAPAAAGVAAGLVSTEAAESTSDDRLLSALAWFTMAILQLPIVSIIQLVSTSTKDRPFQRHHAITSLLFYVAGIAYEIVAGIVYAILGALTLGCGYACLWVIFFVPQALALYFALQAYNGKRIELPVLSQWGRNQGLL